MIAGFVPPKRLYDILLLQERQGIDDRALGTIVDDTRKVGSGDVFVAIEGRSFDGHSACADMLERGASAVVVERDLGLPQQLIVPDSRVAFSMLCSRYFGQPTKQMQLIGVTGTNGKSTTVSLIHLYHAGWTCIEAPCRASVLAESYISDEARRRIRCHMRRP